LWFPEDGWVNDLEMSLKPRAAALRKVLFLALVVALLPCAAFGQVMQNQSDDLKASIASVLVPA
jgi:hypothetical protein